MFTDKEIEELQPPPLPVVDLSQFIKIAKEGKYKIGVIKDDVSGGLSTRFTKGQFILFEPYTAKTQYGNMLWREIKQHCTMCTTCLPFVDSSGKLSTSSTCVGVPLKLISHEIKFD